MQQLNGIGLNHETVIALAQKMYESYDDTLVENLSDALQEQLAGPLGETIQEQLIEPAKETVMETAKRLQLTQRSILAGPETERDRFPEPCFPEREKLTADFPDIDTKK